MEFLEKATNSDAIRIVVTAYMDFEILENAVERGEIYTFHDKPNNMEYIEQLIYEAYKVYLTKKNNL